MLTPDKNFRMNSLIKKMLGLTKFKDAHERGAFTRAMIDAQLSEEAARRAALKSKEGREGDVKPRARGAVAPE
jgi:hypothetical protein